VIQCNIRDISERVRIQKALLEISSHQESLLSAIPDIVMEVDKNKVYTWANTPGIEFFGDDVIGREAAFYFEAEQDTYQLVQPIFNGNENVIYLESWQRRRDGEIRLLAWWCCVLKDESGNVTGALSSARDITESRRAEEALKASEDKFRGIFEYSTVGKSLTAPDGKLLQINKTFADMLGYTIGELQRVNFAEITHPDDIAESRECIRCLLANERESYRMEKRYISKGGVIVWADVSTRMHRNADGKPEYLITSIVNITERKRSEAELRIKNQAFEDSIASQSVANSEGIITHVNPAFLRMWGYATKEQAIGNSVGSFFDDPDDSAPVFQALASHDSWEGRFRAKRADGGIFISHGYSTTMRDQRGNIIGYQSTNLDVTMYVEAEKQIGQYAVELERSNVDLQQFAYVASHDLQEPLRMISSYLQLIEKRYRDRLDADANDFINFAVDGATRLQSLINGLLEFSRVRTHGKTFGRVNVKEVLDGICKDLELLISESGAVMEFGDLPVILADESQIARLFQNLLQNAIKFRKEGIAPRVHITSDMKNGEHVFCVRDNGIGIEVQYLERIFIIFQRLHGREEYPGTGIGLAICKRIVERHNGRIWVESKYGEGSLFYFTIPAP
jgi:PAS domain S-box-containing protein